MTRRRSGPGCKGLRLVRFVLIPRYGESRLIDTRASLNIDNHDRVRLIQFFHTISCRHQSSKRAQSDNILSLWPSSKLNVSIFTSQVTKQIETQDTEHHRPQGDLILSQNRPHDRLANTGEAFSIAHKPNNRSVPSNHSRDF